MSTRLVILLTFFCHLTVIALVGGCGSISQESLPRVDATPTTNKLPIDGIWKPLGKLATPFGTIKGRDIVFKVDGGRMSLYGGNIVGADGTAIVSSGTVVLKDIHPTNESSKYSAFCANFKTNSIGFLTLPIPFDPCEIEIQGDATISTRLLDSSKQALPGLNQTLQKEVLNNEAWFLSAYRGNSTTVPPVASLSVPPTVPVAAPSAAPLVITPPTPQAQYRRALVIGNAAYADSPLTNSVNDATDLATVLRQLGFDVTLHHNANKPTMEKAIDIFTQEVPRGSAGLFFFAGHGVQIDGVNYLVPIGAQFSAASDVKYHAVVADWVLARMDESGMEVKLLLLDACRNNPLGRSWTRTLGRGLAVMETPQGALIAYATSPGKTASDGTGRNSPFTAQLLQELGIPGRDIEVALKAVRAGVQQTTKGEQIPWVASSMTGDFYIAR
jgi:hypothetical protein